MTIFEALDEGDMEAVVAEVGQMNQDQLRIIVYELIDIIEDMRERSSYQISEGLRLGVLALAQVR